MDRDPRFSLADPFDIDDGELGGASSSQAFVLGVEWQAFRVRMLEEPGAFAADVHVANEVRIVRLCRRHGRVVRVRRHAIDGWSSLLVSARFVN